jgi:hypothetical protein
VILAGARACGEADFLIFRCSGSLSIVSSVLRGNHATDEGGAIAFYAYNGAGGSLTTVIGEIDSADGRRGNTGRRSHFVRGRSCG